MASTGSASRNRGGAMASRRWPSPAPALFAAGVSGWKRQV